jgi:hypothetical protein
MGFLELEIPKKWSWGASSPASSWITWRHASSNSYPLEQSIDWGLKFWGIAAKLLFN